MRALIFGGNYGLLLAGALHERGINFDILATPHEAKVFNDEGFSINCKNENCYRVLPGIQWNASTVIKDAEYDIAILSMQEGTYNAANVSHALLRVLEKNTPILNVMNIPLPKFLSKTLRCVSDELGMNTIYSSFSILNKISETTTINASPEPQVYKTEKINEVTIRLGGAFRCSRMGGVIHDQLIKKLTATPLDRSIPVIIKEYQDPWTSVSKWPMLITGNYRCLNEGKVKSISEAVLDNIELSRAIYQEITYNMLALGANKSAIIPFGMYAKAAVNLDAPSSVARAINDGNSIVERVDLLLLKIFSERKLNTKYLEQIVRDMDINLFNKRVEAIDK